MRLGHEHAGLDFWLSSISVQCPKVPIFVVGSHIDQVNLSVEEPRLIIVEFANHVDPDEVAQTVCHLVFEFSMIQQR